MSDTKKIKKEFDELFAEIKKSEKSTRLRFERPFIKVSDIASQYFCEKGVDLKYQHGEVETKAERRGRMGHEMATEKAVEVSMEKIWNGIASKDMYGVYEFPLLIKKKGAIVAGFADYVQFVEGDPYLLLERKFSLSPARAFKNEYLQAEIYCNMLDEMGFDVSPLRYILLKYPRGCVDNRKVTDEVESKVIREYTLAFDVEEERTKIEPATVYYKSFTDNERVKEEIDWALDYWLGKRDPVPTTKIRKCNGCKYSKFCENSNK